ncbi:MAG: hypothetical protein OI74_14465 [Gammaproteobacteria bacterium (ex Lamellibrachia satsuma)]|nr:MAG: hypothetical protein HPY30_05920 [Gammaproteobacteria bacterium (ex Lamellibrachia satsuma)]RRS31538.1 MAG: hypothetical protein OI74_14465 [Gammaproteobacteria bacterium (ex Lamellibrachia satsuma)]RRS35817.1 MAG: hypothetical protein NV67_09115 [Gammaproteobacteria bacterium (ex Lamellibrachia satsuma)]
MATISKKILPGGYWLGALLLVLLLTAIYQKSEFQDTESHARMIEGIGRLKTLNAELDERLLESRFGLSSNYDALVSGEKVFSSYSRDMYRDLGDEEKMVLADAWQGLRENLARKRGAIENFKSENAVLKNSTKYFPIAVKQALLGLEAVPDTEGVRKQIVDLVQTTLYLNQGWKGEPQARAKLLLDELEKKASNLPFEIGESTMSLIMHGRFIILYRSTVDDLIETVRKMEMLSHIESIEQTYLAFHKRQQTLSDIFHVGIFTLSTLLIMLVIYALSSTLSD